MGNPFFTLGPLQAHTVYALAWLSFGAGHSVLAAAWAKGRLEPLLGAYYRLAYNLFASVHIALVWAFGGAVLGGIPSFPLEPGVETTFVGISVLGWVVLVLALREYDLGRFSGLSQLSAHRRGPPPPEDETLVTGGLHRFVRHPLYLGAYMILWGGATGEFGLATAAWGSLYLTLGARFEERALLSTYGEAYRVYQERVPAIIPRKGRT